MLGLAVNSNRINNRINIQVLDAQADFKYAHTLVATFLMCGQLSSGSHTDATHPSLCYCSGVVSPSWSIVMCLPAALAFVGGYLILLLLL